MDIIYTTEEAPATYSKSIFLAGPSPRKDEDGNWRPEALELLEELGFDGVVFVPLPRDGNWPVNYDGVREWERKNLDRADCVVFWVPRDMKRLPGLTTNIEWGVWYDSGRAVLGYPLDAPHMRYLAGDAKDESVPLAHTLKETLQNALKVVGAGSERKDGERDVPLAIWNKPDFQQWYKSQTAAGNRLDGAKVVWTFRVGSLKSKVFLYALHVNIWVTAEGRAKVNEVAIFRPDISVIIALNAAFGPDLDDRDIDERKIVLVREFRAPASTTDGMIHELPGGSQPNEDPESAASHEFGEETGMEISPDRFKYMGARQLAGTLSAHKAHVFGVLLTDEEITQFEAQADSGEHKGVEDDTERTYIEVTTIEKLLRNPNVDWSMMGMILTALHTP